MAQTNNVTVSGNLTKDPEFYTLEDGKVSCSFSIAVNNKYEKNGETINEPSFFSVKTYGEAAEKMKEAKKGMLYSASGMVKQKVFEKDNGQKSSMFEVLAFDVNSIEKENTQKQSAFIKFAGNLADDPVVSTYDSGKKKCSFTVINNNEYTNKAGETVKDNTALKVELWNDGVDAAKDLKKGALCKVEGFLKQNKWDKDGVNYSSISIQGTKVENLLKKEKKIEQPSMER